jgi:uncharacterized delta-60 repeat protein
MVVNSVAAVLGVAAFLYIGAVSPAFAWEVAVNGRPTSDRDEATAVGVDPQTGAVFVAGQRQATSTDSAFIVTKFNSAGIKQWQHIVRREGIRDGNATELVVDSNGFVFVAGWVVDGGSTSTLLMKLDGRSLRKQVVFSRRIDASGLSPNVMAMRLTNDGGVALAGSVVVNGLTSIYLMKFTADGQDAWPLPQVFAGSAANGFNSAQALDNLPGGDLAVVGSLANTGSNHDAIVARFDGSTGERRWLALLNHPVANGDDFGSAVSVSADGDIVGAGSMFSGGVTFRDFIVFRLSESGTLLWLKALDRGFSDTARTVAIGPDGNVVAGGRLEPSSGANSSIFFVVGLRGTDGAERWRYESAGVAAQLEARDIALDANGNPVVTGLGAAAGALSAFTVMALDRDAGTVLWNAPIVGNVPLVNEGRVVVADRTRNAVIAAGVTQNDRQSFDLTVSHFINGREDWRQVINGRGKRLDRQDAAVALAVDARTGSLAIAGSSQNTGGGILGTPGDFTIAKIRKTGEAGWKYDFVDRLPHLANLALAVTIAPSGSIFGAGRTCDVSLTSCFTVVGTSRIGKEMWRTIVLGAVPGRDEARAITIDPKDGNIIAAGTVHSSTGPTFAVVKLDSQTGSLIWSSPSAPGAAHALVLTSRATVAVAGHLAGNLAVVEFDTVTGTPVAVGVRPGFGAAYSVAFDAKKGTVVASGSAPAGPLGTAIGVAKFDAAGTLLWSTTVGNLSSFGTIQGGLAIHQDTGVIAVAGQVPAITLLDSDGMQLWQTASEAGSAAAVSFAGSNVVAVGQIRDVEGRWAFTVSAFSADGTVLWRRAFQGTADFGLDGAAAVAVDDARGSIYATGTLTNDQTASDMFVVGLTFDGSDIPLPLATTP